MNRAELHAAIDAKGNAINALMAEKRELKAELLAIERRAESLRWQASEPGLAADQVEAMLAEAAELMGVDA